MFEPADSSNYELGLKLREQLADKLEREIQKWVDNLPRKN